MDKNAKQLIFLVILIISGLIYAYYAYLFTPEWANIQLLQQYRQEGQSRYEKLLAYQENRHELEEEIVNLEAEYIELHHKFPNQVDKPQIVRELYTVAKVNMVQPKSVTFGELESMDTYDIQAITFSCLGPQANVIKMINELQTEENLSYTLESLDFTNTEGILEGEIILKAYINKISADIGEEISAEELSPERSTIGEVSAEDLTSEEATTEGFITEEAPTEGNSTEEDSAE